MANYFPMVDAFPQIKALLEELPDQPKVTERWPRSECSPPLIVVSELTNTHTAVKCVDQLTYQIDIWTRDSEALRRLSNDVDEAMTNMGFRRTLAQPEDDTDGFLRTFRYGRKVDKRLMRLID